MIDYYIFGFGLVVTLVVGSGLSAMIVASNRAAARQREPEKSPAVVPVRVRRRDR